MAAELSVSAEHTKGPVAILDWDRTVMAVLSSHSSLPAGYKHAVGHYRGCIEPGPIEGIAIASGLSSAWQPE